MHDALNIALGIVLAVVALGMLPIPIAIVVQRRELWCSLVDHRWERVEEYTVGGVLSYKTVHRCKRCGGAPNLIESGELRRMSPDA